MEIALSIGNFDAVHCGHLAIVQGARQAVGDGKVEIWSFNPSPVCILQPEIEVERLTTFSQRRVLLLEAGADEVVELTPTKALLSQSPTLFVESFMETLAPQFVVEGEGFRFGKDRVGTVEELSKLGDSFGFSMLRVPPIEVSLRDNTTHLASSSLVRKLIKCGRVEDAQTVLGRSVSLSGLVASGDQRGHGLGFPTANLEKIETLLPADGIYAGRGTLEDGTYFPAAISVGTKPTFGENDRTCEAHLIGFDGKSDRYGWKLELTFDHWLRDQIRFDSVEDLKQAIQDDVEQTSRLLERNT